MLVFACFLFDVLRQAVLLLLLVSGWLAADLDDLVHYLLLLPPAIAVQVTLFAASECLYVSLHILLTLSGVLLQLLVLVVLVVEALPKHIQHLVSELLGKGSGLLRTMSMISLEC